MALRPRPRARWVAAVLPAAAVLLGTAAIPAEAAAPVPLRVGATLQNRVTVTVRLGPATPARTWTLDCDTFRDTHPATAGACAQLRSQPRPFAPVPPGTYCPQIYGGPQVAWVYGHWRGQRVLARFTRVNGCEIARWDAVRRLLQP